MAGVRDVNQPSGRRGIRRALGGARPRVRSMPEHARVPDFADLSLLPRRRLAAMRRASRELFDVLESFDHAGRHPVRDLLATTPDELAHYPAGDAHDSATGSWWYYHTHERDWSEHGHFHCFAYTELLRAGARPLALPENPDRANGGLVHLAALGVDASGVPMRLFTLNRWATGEWLYPAAEVIPLVDRFAPGKSSPFPWTGRLLGATLRLLWPQVTWALRERDRVLAARRRLDSDFAEDQSLEVTSEVVFNLDDHLAALDRAWER